MCFLTSVWFLTLHVYMCIIETCKTVAWSFQFQCKCSVTTICLSSLRNTCDYNFDRVKVLSLNKHKFTIAATTCIHALLQTSDQLNFSLSSNYCNKWQKLMTKTVKSIRHATFFISFLLRETLCGWPWSCTDAEGKWSHISLTSLNTAVIQ